MILRTYVLPVPGPHGGLVGVQDESALGVHRSGGHGNLDEFSLVLSTGPKLEKVGLFLGGLDPVKTRIDAPLQIFQVSEAVQKLVGLPSLDLPVLNGGPTQVVVGLYHLVGGGPVFVLGGFRSDPDVNVVLQVGRVAPRGFQDNVRIALEELACVVETMRSNRKVLVYLRIYRLKSKRQK